VAAAPRTCREIHYCAKSRVVHPRALHIGPRSVDCRPGKQRSAARNRPSFCANIHHDRLYRERSSSASSQEGSSLWKDRRGHPTFPNGPNSYQFVNVTVATHGTVGVLRKGRGKRDVPLQREGLEVVHNAKQPLPTMRSTGSPLGAALHLGKHVRRRVRRDSAGNRHRIDASHVYGTNVGMVGVSNNISYIAASSVAVRRRRNVVMTCIFLPADRRTLYHPRVQWNLAKNAVMTSFGGTRSPVSRTGLSIDACCRRIRQPLGDHPRSCL